jgi:hypothetical protein
VHSTGLCHLSVASILSQDIDSSLALFCVVTDLS